MARNRRRTALGSLASLLLLGTISTAGAASGVKTVAPILATKTAKTKYGNASLDSSSQQNLLRVSALSGPKDAIAVRKPRGSGKVRPRTPSNRANFRTRDITPKEVGKLRAFFDNAVKQKYPGFPRIDSGDNPGEFRILEWTDLTTGTTDYKVYFAPDNPGSPSRDIEISKAVTPEDVADMALDQVTLSLPGAKFNPALNSRNHPPLVHMPLVWDAPNATTATARAAVGAVAATATAEPIATYGNRLSDLEGAICPGKGVAWSAGLNTSDPSVCSMTFENPVQGETLIVGVLYWVTYSFTVNGAPGAAGTLGPAAVEEVISNVNIYERHAIGTRR